jgi:S-DNA-T family DNA segregation ATPase FtsK/SpoIIIE
MYDSTFMFNKIFMYSKARSLTLLMLAIIFSLSLASYHQSDPSFNLATSSAASNLLGVFGSYLADILYQFFGIVAWIIPISLASWSYIIYKNGQLSWRFIKFPSLLIAMSCASITFSPVEINALPADGGGVAGIYLMKIAMRLFAELNQIILPLAAALSMFFLIIALGIRVSAYINFTTMIANFIATITSYITKLLTGKKEDYSAKSANAAPWDITPVATTKNWLEKLPKFKLPNFSWTPKEQPFKAPMNKAEPLITQSETYARANSQPTPQASIPQTAFVQTSTSPSNAPFKPTEQEFGPLPSVDLLDDVKDQHIQMQSPTELEQKAQELILVLGDFGVKGKVVDIRQGPVVTMYEFEPAAGTKSSRVIGLSDDIARSLSAISTRIAVIPGRNALGIELPNKQRMFFRLKELVQTAEFQDKSIILPLILGKDLGGTPMVADLAKMPHLLVAGTTGSGKSVAINAMIMSLLYRYTPEECRMIMIDPKMLELSAYDNIPHLMTPVVTEPGKAVVALKWAVKEMENRYRLMSHLGVRSIANYNTKLQEAVKDGQILERKIQTGFDPETGKPSYESVPIDMNKMPFIVVIVDEMADLNAGCGQGY